MKFTLEFSMGNAAFDDDPLAEIDSIFAQVLEQNHYVSWPNKRRVLDSNGNVVGSWVVSE